MKNVQANQFYNEMQNAMPTHKEENIFEHFKTTDTGSVCKCIKRREQNYASGSRLKKHVSVSGSITSVEEERANLSAVVYLKLCGFCLERFPLPLGAWDGLHCFLWHSLSLPYNYFVKDLH